MRALFQRWNRGLTKDRDKEQPHSPSVQLPPLPEWPPPHVDVDANDVKPLPDILAASEQPELDDVKLSRRQANGSSPADVHKKVAFLSPPPTPSGLHADKDLPDPESGSSSDAVVATASAPTVAVSAPATAKSAVTRTQSKDPRGSTSTAPSTATAVATTSRTDVGSSSKAASTRAASSRTAMSPYPQSLRSNTPFSQMSNASSRILAASSWSEVAEEDLVSNLGPRERTRQEVLWEIVASEERYVNDLVRMRDTFIEPLLHPFAPAPTSALSPMPFPEYDDEPPRVDTPQESLEQLPIAARFMSPSRAEGSTELSRRDTTEKTSLPPTPIIDAESLDTEEEDENDDQLGRGFSSSGPGPNARALAAKLNHPRSPYRAGTGASVKSSIKGGTVGSSAVPFPSRSHHSLPAQPRANPMAASSQSLGRERDRNHSTGPGTPPTPASTSDRKVASPPGGGPRVLRKLRKSQTRAGSVKVPASPAVGSSGSGAASGGTNGHGDVLVNGAVPPHLVPDDLRICLEVIESGVLDGHMRLSEGLRKRYDDQYPLVRSLADVFVSNSHIFQGYATYVLHLERALEQVDNALSNAANTKKPKNQDAAEWLRVCRFLRRLEETAADRGETGLAISLSKPFQRLLKYPLLFQNLLFHTDPSTFEYEATLQMVAEVETIVRSIEDEKIQKEDRDKTRDVFARIEGLEKVKQLAIPKPSRLLVEERQVADVGSGSGFSSANGSPKATGSPGSSSPTLVSPKAVKGKTSFKRLSDVLGSGSSGIGGKKDLWLVVFNDVVLRCQRTGTTSLPLVSSTTNARTTSLPELQGRTGAKYATTGRRNSHLRPRNLYKFLKIETWQIGDVVQPKEGVVSMEDVVRSKEQAHSSTQPRIVPLPDDDGDDVGDSDDSDKKSKMSFSYWGADKVTLQKPVLRPRPHGHGHPHSHSSPHAHSGPHATAGAHAAATRRASPVSPSYGRESSANAKFGTRLVSGDAGVPGASRPASRRTQNTTATRTRGNTGASVGASANIAGGAGAGAGAIAGASAAASEDAQSMKATVTRPAWDTSTRATTTPTPKRQRQTSQTSAAPRAAAAGATALSAASNMSGNSNNASIATNSTTTSKIASPAPSEDSGVGMYRQMAAQDPSLMQ